MLIALPVIVLFLGAFLWFVAAPKWAELGRIAFHAGLFVTLWAFGNGHALRLW